jgi:hypothetical protein
MLGDEMVHIIPVGFEKDRVLFGLLELGAKRIYLLFDNKEDVWGKESRKYCRMAKDDLKNFFFDSENLYEVPFDPTSYESCENAISEILEKEREAQRIYINVSTSTKLSAIASALKAMEYDNVFLYYVVPKQYNLPPEGKPFSSGAKRMEVFSPRGFQIGDLERKILRALDSSTITSLGELNKSIIPDDISKASRAKLSYYVRKLQREGYVNFIPGKQIVLTSLGRSRLYPPVDDAKVIASSRKKSLQESPEGAHTREGN